MCNNPIGFSGEVAVERAEGKHKPLSSLRRQTVGQTPARSATEVPPQAERCVGARREVCIQRDDGRDGHRRVGAPNQYHGQTTIGVADAQIVAVRRMALECRRQPAEIECAGE